MAASTYRCEDAEVARGTSLIEIVDTKRIKQMDQDSLLSLQTKLGYGSKWGVIEIPEEFMPPGQRMKGQLRWDIYGYLPKHYKKDSRRSDAAITSILRLIWIRYYSPIGKVRTPPTISTWVGYMAHILRLARSALLSRDSAPGKKFWATLSTNDVFSAVPGNAGSRLIRMFSWYRQHNLIDDYIRLPPSSRGAIDERSRKGEPAATSPQRQITTWQPLPDEFTAEYGWRAAWLTRHLGSQLLDVADAIQVINESGSSRRARTAAIAKLLVEWQWKSNGQPLNDSTIRSLFARRDAPISGPDSEQLLWPPRTAPDLWNLIAQLQASHAFVVLLSGGPRTSEILSQKDDCLRESPDGWRVQGRTYKLVYRDEGKERDWPTPELSVIAVQQQIRLANLAKEIGKLEGHKLSGKHLWVNLPIGKRSQSGRLRNGIAGMLKRSAMHFGVLHLLGNSTFHPHRCRKTIGRLIGLAVAGSPKILMDLFGHRDPEMTMGYILANKDIAAEARAVAKAQVILMAKDAIEQVADNGGLAAPWLNEKVEDRARLLGKSILDPRDIEELALQLTLEGRYWQLVRAGVICTKLPGQIGPCNQQQGHPDPGHCRSECGKRLELSTERANVDETLSMLASHLDKAEFDSDEMMAEMWRGQILANLYRFGDLFAKWSTHPSIAAELAREQARRMTR